MTSSSTSGHQSHESLESGSESPVTECETSNAACSANKSFLLRLFESTLFDMSMAITYLFNSKEPGVQSYIGWWIVAKEFTYLVRKLNLKIFRQQVI